MLRRRDPAHSWLTVSLSGIAWSGYTDEECNFIQMCHKNPNLPAIEVTQESNAPAEGRGPSSTCTSVKLSDLCVGLDLIPAVLAAFGVGPGEQSAEQEVGAAPLFLPPARPPVALRAQNLHAAKSSRIVSLKLGPHATYGWNVCIGFSRARYTFHYISPAALLFAVLF